MRAAIYARVSSDKQRDEQTVESQLDVLRPFVARQAWQTIGEYIDDGRSAKTGMLERRDAWARLIRDAEAGRFDVLVTFDVDRLTRTRSIEERATIIGPFQRLGIQVATPSGGVLDLRSFLGEFWVTIKALVAAEENRARAERIKAGIERAANRGRKPKGRTPYGWTYSHETKQMAIDEDAAALIREASRRVIAGESCDKIAADFDARGARPPGRMWSRNALWLFLTSRRVVGEWTVHRQKRLTIRIPPIIDESTWQAAQQALASGRQRGLRRTKHIYLLEELGTCARCGGPVHIRSDKNRKYAAYICRARKTDYLGKRCEAPTVRADDADARVWAAIRCKLDDPRFAAEIEERMSKRAENRRDWTKDAAKHRAKLERLAKAEAGTLARYRKGLISDAAYDAELEAARADRVATEEQLRAAEAGAADRGGLPEVDVRGWLESLRKLAAEDSPEARRRIARAILKPGSVVFDGQRVRFTMFVRAEAGHVPSRAALSSQKSSRDGSDAVLEIRAVA